MISFLFAKGINRLAIEIEKQTKKGGWTKSIDCTSAL